MFNFFTTINIVALKQERGQNAQGTLRTRGQEGNPKKVQRYLLCPN